MKVRGDFVTNSSSSSFIIAYKDAEEMNNAITEFVNKYMAGIDDDYDDYEYKQYSRVIADIFVKRLPYKEAIKKVKEFAEEDCWYKFAQNFNREIYHSQKEWYDSYECKKLRNNYVKSRVESFKNEYPETSYISYLHYSESSEMYYVKDDLSNMLKGVLFSMNGD